MEILKKEPRINFMGHRKAALVLSTALVLLSAISLFTRGLSFGLDFTGGTLIEVAYTTAPELEAVRGDLEGAGFSDAIVQTFGSAKDIVVRLAPRGEKNSASISTEVLDALNSDPENRAEMRRVEFVGPQVGEELAENGGLAMLFALIGILIYVTLRFEKRFSVGAVAALIHDVMIIAGVFSLFAVEFDLTVLAALLAVIGYSLNDTIVVYDRIRENFRMLRKGTAVDVVNRSINQMLTRTIMTSVTTLLVLSSLYLFGGAVIHSFAFALIIGVLVGTYSSIYVASSAALMMGISKQDLMLVEKEGADMRGMP